MQTSPTEHFNPWASLWTHPRITLRRILDTNPKKYVLLLAMLGTIFMGLSQLSTVWVKQPHREEYHNPTMIILIIVLGAILGLIHLYVGGWLYKIVGSWLGGKGSYVDLRSATGWSSYPLIVGYILVILGNLIFGRHGMLVTSLVALVVNVWAFVIFCNLIGEAHRFSSWKGLGTLLIIIIFFVVVFALLLLLVPMLRPLFM